MLMMPEKAKYVSFTLQESSMMIEVLLEAKQAFITSGHRIG